MATAIVESAPSNGVMFTRPTFSPENGVLFSAFCLHLGYAGFALSFDAACRRFGARGQQRDESLLAFESNKPHIAQVAAKKLERANGIRIVLSASDFD
jgi:hypothetical protein